MTITERQRRTKDRIARRLEELPLLPAVVAEIASMDPDSPEFVQQVEDLARTDPPFALRLLKMANGGSRPPENPILTIPQSIMRIGARPLASTITSMAVMRVFVPTTKGQKNLWNHALQVAECAGNRGSTAGTQHQTGSRLSRGPAARRRSLRDVRRVPQRARPVDLRVV
jgi:HD-like signal output (HDOD) protein